MTHSFCFVNWRAPAIAAVVYHGAAVFPTAHSHRALGVLVVVWPVSAGLDVGPRERQRKDEARAAIGRILGPDLAAVRLHNALADRQAQAGAAGMALGPDRAHKFFEDSRAQATWYTLLTRQSGEDAWKSLRRISRSSRCC
jgi:hypothetical protein